jgi:hypothetical protein
VFQKGAKRKKANERNEGKQLDVTDKDMTIREKEGENESIV